jgi:hypothetical protein
MPLPPLKIFTVANSKIMEDTNRQKLLSAAFHEVETIIGGHAMRPLSLASYDVLLRTENPLVRGEMPEDGTPEFTSAIMAFVFVHCAPWPEVVRASFDAQAFRESALIFCGGLSPTDFQTAFKRLEEQSRELEAAQIDTIGDIGGKKPQTATNPAS